MLCLSHLIFLLSQEHQYLDTCPELFLEILIHWHRMHWSMHQTMIKYHWPRIFDHTPMWSNISLCDSDARKFAKLWNMPGSATLISVLMAHVSHSNRKQRFRRLSYTCLGEQVIFKRNLILLFTNASYISWCKLIFISSKKCFISLVFELLYAKSYKLSFKNIWDSFATRSPRFSILYSINGIKHISPFVQEDIHYLFVISKMLYMSFFSSFLSSLYYYERAFQSTMVLNFSKT